MPILRRILRAAALLTLAAGSGLAAAEPVALPAPEWIAVSGDWKITDGRIAELSDGVAPGDRPLWSTAGSPAAAGVRYTAGRGKPYRQGEGSPRATYTGTASPGIGWARRTRRRRR